jgi:fermentation-respiration switch protein FrsA (DUF1100 family)
METKVTIQSDGIDLVGSLHIPDDLKPGEKRPAFIATHGFGGSRIDGSMAAVAPQLCEWGYPTLRFDSRGCGESGGERGRIIPMDQVGDLGNVLKWMAQQDGVDPEKIIILGIALGLLFRCIRAGRTRMSPPWWPLAAGEMALPR